MNPAHIANHRGDTYLRRGQVRRMSLTTVYYAEVEITVHYECDGVYYPATATEPAEYPTCVIKKLEISGQDVTKLLADTRVADRLAEQVEESWRVES